MLEGVIFWFASDIPYYAGKLWAVSLGFSESPAVVFGIILAVACLIAYLAIRRERISN